MNEKVITRKVAPIAKAKGIPFFIFPSIIFSPLGKALVQFIALALQSDQLKSQMILHLDGHVLRQYLHICLIVD